MNDPSPLPRGVIYTATGKPHYTALAIRSAQSMRQHNPGLPIDLLTDRPVETDAFDHILIEPELGRHSKLTALALSRFERTLYLDSDTIVLASLTDVFDVLERFDIALTHDQFLSNPYCRITFRAVLPEAYPQFNGGFMALRRSEATVAFLDSWKDAVLNHGVGRDQPALREVLWSSSLRIATLPPEYNMMNLDLMKAKPLDRYHAAPRVIHNPHFHLHYEAFKDSPNPAADSLGLWQEGRLNILLREDQTLPRNNGKNLGRASRFERARFQIEVLRRLVPKIPRAVQFNMRYRGKRLLAFLARMNSRNERATESTRGRSE